MSDHLKCYQFGIRWNDSDMGQWVERMRAGIKLGGYNDRCQEFHCNAHDTIFRFSPDLELVELGTILFHAGIQIESLVNCELARHLYFQQQSFDPYKVERLGFDHVARGLLQAHVAIAIGGTR